MSGTADGLDTSTADGFHAWRKRGYRYDEPRLDFLILTMPDREIVSLSLREGIDFLDEGWPEFGDFYILETGGES